jgi:hypothetical protein
MLTKFSIGFYGALPMSCLLVAACFTVHQTQGEIEPTYPPLDHIFLERNGSNGVVFEWSDKKDGGKSVTYSLAVWEAISITLPSGKQKLVRGEQILIANDLPCCRFAPPQPLSSGRNYLWSAKRTSDRYWATTVREERLAYFDNSTRVKSDSAESLFPFRIDPEQ